MDQSILRSKSQSFNQSIDQ